jgi:60 kDa SS-A/Ro ribonucleoprotein
MNLNTLARQGAFSLPGVPEQVAAKLANAEMIARSRVFPYQVLAAYRNAGDDVPGVVKEALQDALEHALRSVPAIPGKLLVCVDVSGSMNAPISGYRGSASSAVRCVDVAALFAAAVLRKNPLATVRPFAQAVLDCSLNSRDSVLTNAHTLARFCGGGTNCSAPLEAANAANERADLVVYVSDNESWIDAQKGGRATAMMHQWDRFKRSNPDAKLVCIDCTPNGTTQALERADVLNIGGFSDRVFELIAGFSEGVMNVEHWLGEIDAVDVLDMSGRALRAA